MKLSLHKGLTYAWGDNDNDVDENDAGKARPVQMATRSDDECLEDLSTIPQFHDDGWCRNGSGDGIGIDWPVGSSSRFNNLAKARNATIIILCWCFLKR